MQRVVSLLKYQTSVIDQEKKYFPAMENWYKLMALVDRKLDRHIVVVVHKIEYFLCGATP